MYDFNNSRTKAERQSDFADFSSYDSDSCSHMAAGAYPLFVAHQFRPWPDWWVNSTDETGDLAPGQAEGPKK